jgi:plastocyanin
MNTEVREMRERAIYPILIPLTAIVIVEFVVFSMSRVLLVAGKTPATAIALGVAVGILMGSAFVAARPRMGKGAIGGLLTLVALVVAGSGAWALTQKPFYEREAEASRPEIDVVAADLAFDTKTLNLSPEGTTINFDNEDTQPHNIAVYPGAKELKDPYFQGAIINGGAKAVYDVPAIEVGEYYFQCDVHPTMNGDAIVEEGAGSEAHE